MGFPQHKASLVCYIIPASEKLVVTLSQIVNFGVNEVGIYNYLNYSNSMIDLWSAQHIVVFIII